jgi:hypothetical protein
MEGPKPSYYRLAYSYLHSQYNGQLQRDQTTLTIALHGDFYIAIIMDRY